MLQALKEEANYTLTQNGALTYSSSGNHCLDLFAVIGALRNSSDRTINTLFELAYCENPDIAMKILFFARDVRGGLGERRIFRTISQHLTYTQPQSVSKNLHYIAEYGRWDDLLCLLNTPCKAQVLTTIKEQFHNDLQALAANGKISLLAKWLPSTNASNWQARRFAKLLIKKLQMTNKEYRQALASLRSRIKIIENNLRQNDYSFAYSKQPAKALYKYRKAFLRNDSKRYKLFLDDVNSGKRKLNTKTLTPHDIVHTILSFPYYQSQDERFALDTTWKALPDYTNCANALVVVDGSGSMYFGREILPIDVAISLAIYYAEHNKGAFANHFITFSTTPRLVEIEGRDIYEKAKYCMSYNECSNTNLKNVFELVLNAAIKHNIPQEDMPTKLYIISDMEFDSCADAADITNFAYAKKLFAQHGYKLPQIVFWNVDSKSSQQPVKLDETGTFLVSGTSPMVFSLLQKDNLNPLKLMLQTLSAPRYSAIAA